MKSSVLIGALTLVAALAAAPSAGAEWSRPELISSSVREQSDGINSSELSADGRYLVFAGSLDGKAGILRRNLETGAVETVAAASAYGGAPIINSSNPSVSADGRYVSFTTEAALDPADDRNGVADVYVRDMDMAAPSGGAPCAEGEPCAYTLVSAVDGGSEGLTYAAGSRPTTSGAVAGRAAISADGTRVAFLVRSPSNLTEGTQQPYQVAFRDLATDRTMLVSATRDPLTGEMTDEQVPRGATGTPQSVFSPGFPVLSADGTTVAWSAIDVGKQVATVQGDPASEGFEGYNEVLWRRIGETAAAPTRRVVGAADPEAPGCPPHGSFSEPACRGPYAFAVGNEDLGFAAGWNQNGGAEPSLSADGWTVATTGAPITSLTHVTDLFVVDMHPGLTPAEAITRLTLGMEVALSPEFNSVNTIEEPTLSADGERVAFATGRREWRLTKPTLLNSPPPLLGSRELWLIDREGETLQRITQTVDGSASNGGASGTGGASSPSFAAGGRLLAFDSTASNLVAVDKNEVADAFLSSNDSVPAGTPGRVDISAAPAPRSVRPGWRLALHAVSRPDGSVDIVADCPGAGRLRAAAKAPLADSARRGRPAAIRPVGAGLRRVPAAGTDRLVLRLAPRLRGLAHRPGGLEGTATVTFAARGHAKLHETLPVRFRARGKGRR